MNSLVFEATGSASVQLVADFTLNAVGGTGDGYAEACLSAFGDRPTFSSSGVAEASFGNALGSTAVASAGYPSMSCDSFPPSHGFLPFRFGVPLTATLRLSATGYTQYGGTTQASAELWGFQFFDPEMQLLSGIRYTLTPAEPLPPGLPEPATLPLVGASASLVLVAARLRQPKA
jgi:hypothetical protein